MRMRKFLLTGVFQMILIVAFCQAATHISVSTDKQKILIGEPFLLTIEWQVPLQSKLSFTLPDSIEHFEILDKLPVDSLAGKAGKTIVQKYKLTSFDSGHWQIPVFSLSKKIYSSPLHIDVVFSHFDPEQDYHNIKDIMTVEVPKKKFPWWWIAVGLLLVVLLIYFYRRRKKIQPVQPVAAIANPYTDAIQQLDRLQQQPPETKEYYSTLVRIFRVYIFRKKGILSLQETTHELLWQLKNIIKDNTQYDNLSEALRNSDAVKFAKYKPVQDDDRKTFASIKKAIDYIEQNERNNAV